MNPGHDHHLANLRRHAKRRALERLGLKLTRNLRGEIVAQILGGRGVFLGMGHGPLRTRWGVILRGVYCHVIYDERAKEVCTIFPWGRR